MAPDEPTAGTIDPPPAPPSPHPPSGRRLVRSRRNRYLAGVCGGMGEYFDVDPVIFRIGAVVLIFAGGGGILLYLLAWLLIPEDGRRRSIGESLPRQRRHWIPIALIALGVVLVFGPILDAGRRGRNFVPALILVGIGAALLYRSQQRDLPWHDDTGTDEPPLFPPVQPAAEPFSAASRSSTPPYWPPPADWVQAHGLEDTDSFDDLYPPVNRPPSATPVLLSFLLLLGGGAALLSVTAGVHISVAGFLAVALILTGLTLLLRAPRGRSRGLIPLGVVLTLALAVAATVEPPLERGVGQRTWVPVSVASLRQPFRLGAGKATLDLTHLRHLRGTPTVTADVTAGQLTVIVPPNVNIAGDARTRLGDVMLFGESFNRDGPAQDVRIHHPNPAKRGAPTLTLHLRAVIGLVEVTNAQ